MAVTATQINEGYVEGFNGREMREYKMVLSGGSTSGNLADATGGDAGWGLVTSVSIVTTLNPTTAPVWYFDGTKLYFAGIAANDTFYMKVEGDRF